MYFTVENSQFLLETYMQINLIPEIKSLALLCSHSTTAIWVSSLITQFGPGLCFYPEFGVPVRRKDQAEPWFGVWRKEWAEPWFGRFRVRRKDMAEPWLGRFRVRRKEWAKPWFGRFRERNGPNPGSEKGMGRTLGSEKEPGRTLIRSLGSELGERNGPNPGLAGSEFRERTFVCSFFFFYSFFNFSFFLLFFFSHFFLFFSLTFFFIYIFFLMFFFSHFHFFSFFFFDFFFLFFSHFHLFVFSFSFSFFLFLAHLSRRLIGELIVYQWLRRLSSVVRQHFQTSSPLKLLGQLNSLLRMGEQKFVQMVLVTWPRWPPRPYMVKTLKNVLLQNQKADELGTWYVALGLWGLPSLFKWWS